VDERNGRCQEAGLAPVGGCVILDVSGSWELGAGGWELGAESTRTAGDGWNRQTATLELAMRLGSVMRPERLERTNGFNARARLPRELKKGSRAG